MWTIDRDARVQDTPSRTAGLLLLAVAALSPLSGACAAPGGELDESDAVEDVGDATLAVGVDGDGDGYTTPKDCDDGDASVHPYNKEINNGVDDDCNGTADEPMLRYSPSRPPEDQSYAQLATFELRIADAGTRSYLDAGGTLKYNFEFQRLSDASTPDYVTPLESMTIVAGDNWKTGNNILFLNPNHPNRGLFSRTVYRFKVQLYTSAGVALGPQSDYFYVVTAGTASDPGGTLKWGRVDMVLHALDQYGDSEDGLIGANGTVDPDGSRFTGSSLMPLHPNYNPATAGYVGDDLMWCDWFYRWVGVMASDAADGQLAINPVLDGGTTFWRDTMNPNNVPNGFRDPLDDGCGTELLDADGDGTRNEVLHAGCQQYTSAEVILDTDDNEFFSNISTNIYYNATQSLPEHQKMGNYQAMDSHAGMFLAFDPDGDGTATGAGGSGTVWSIEGNVGNKVKIMHREPTNPVINGFGKLTVPMFQ